MFIFREVSLLLDGTNVDLYIDAILDRNLIGVDGKEYLKKYIDNGYTLRDPDGYKLGWKLDALLKESDIDFQLEFMSGLYLLKNVEAWVCRDNYRETSIEDSQKLYEYMRNGMVLSINYEKNYIVSDVRDGLHPSSLTRKLLVNSDRKPRYGSEKLVNHFFDILGEKLELPLSGYFRYGEILDKILENYICRWNTKEKFGVPGSEGRDVIAKFGIIRSGSGFTIVSYTRPLWKIKD